MKYSACVSALFLGKPVEETLDAVKAAGLNQYEFWSWWDQDTERILEAQQRTGLRPAAFCTRMVSLVEPAHRNEYLDGLSETAEVCRKLECSAVITQVGAELKNVSREKQHESLVEGLKACVPLLEKNDLTLVFEPLNTKIDHPGYYLTASEEAFQLVDEVGSSRVKVLFDLYHQYITEGLNIERILKSLDKIGHFHVAGYPGRHEPLVHSEIDYPLILRALSEAGFDQTVGLEYFPQEDAVQGLSALMQTLKQF